ncbi:hypothetical protein [Kitasatospora sp. GP82]|uniref:hypothetical protein n=1 Tax=Kitasatospora sp. GP82 TaxID=3035089 RepID=UPI0024760B99|nr:hypothetical protein [Kitasatospora sp. GP82]MDH6130058.1 hypothetical protein [Kitasatospora sp. GP82]
MLRERVLTVRTMGLTSGGAWHRSSEIAHRYRLTMTPAELQQLLVTHLPDVPGIATADVWPQRPYGLTVTLAGSGANVHWMVTGASGVAPAAGDDRLAPPALPDLTTSPTQLADVELALLATLARSTEGVVRADRYSTRAQPPAVVFGATVDCTDGWRLFLSAVGTSARAGDRLRPVTAGATA